MKENLIKLAFATQPHGIKGEVDVRLLNPNAEDSALREGLTVMLYPGSPKSDVSPGGEEWKISKIRFGNKVICTLEGIKDRTHLETLLPFDIYLDRKDFPETDEDEVYLVDLIEMPVYSPDGVELGKLESFSDNGMQYLFEIRLVDGSKITLPYVDSFFPEIDTEAGRIIMILPEYSE